MSAVAERKRFPLVRPLCPIHGIPMVVYAANDSMRYHKCVIDGCGCRGKQPKSRPKESDGYLQDEL